MKILNETELLEIDGGVTGEGDGCIKDPIGDAIRNIFK